jgi:hypothetical protein
VCKNHHQPVEEGSHYQVLVPDPDLDPVQDVDHHHPFARTTGAEGLVLSEPR